MAARPVGRLPHIIATGAYGELRMRIEIQHLVKLPLTDAVLFTIAYQLAPLSQLADVPEWRDQLISVLGELPEDMAAYKNFASVRSEIVAWLKQSAIVPGATNL